MGLASSYINAPDQKTYWTTVLDGCKFGDYLPEADGCSMIWLTEKVSYWRISKFNR
jgi:hypothetical protein